MYDLNDNAHGVRFSGNDKFILAAFNAYHLYGLLSPPKSNVQEYRITYPHLELYVYSLAVIDLPDITDNNDLVAFVQIAENMTSSSSSSDSLKSVVFSMIIVNISEGKIVGKRDHIIWSNEIHQEYMLLKVDPQQKYVYVFTDLAVFSYELATDTIDQIVLMNNTVFWSDLPHISVRSFDLTNEWALVAAYIDDCYYCSRSFHSVLLLELRPLRLVTRQPFHDHNIDTSEALGYNLFYDFSVSIAPDNSLVAIGAPSLNSVTLCKITRSEDDNQTYRIKDLKRDAVATTLTSGNKGFGRSVTWIDADGTNLLFVLVDTAKQQIWSPSQIRVYSNISISTKMVDGIPDFVFPNTQQRTLDEFYRKKLSILQLLTVNNSLLFLASDAYIFYIPSASLGLCSVMINNNGFTFMNVFQPQPCVGGSYKNKASIGPCTPCPPQTKSAMVNIDNNTTTPMSMCIPCDLGSFCPLGAAGDLNLSDVAPHTQTFAYPSGGATDNYDDLLLQNFFTFRVVSAHCVVVSPLFWLILIFVLCFIIWLNMHMTKSGTKRTFCSSNIQQRRIKLFLKHIDIIHEGQCWISGLATFVIVIIIGMTIWFAVDYVKLYPIESSSDMRAACDASLRNARFDNALQVALPMSDGSQWMIFDRLDAQPFSMSIDVINTAASCENVSVQQNRGSALPPVDLVKETCSLTIGNVTVSFSFALPAHETTIQVDVLGPYFIGALRLCLRAPSDHSQKPNYVHELDVCSLFFTPNQTVGLYTEFTARLVKVVNVTKPLSNDGDTIYDGRWYLKISSRSLSDELVLRQYGEYMRYLNDRTSFVIHFSEESYFLQNNQKPVIQVAALAFHTLLFISLVIEMFAISFLLFKLCCLPMLQTVRTALFSKKRKRKLEYAHNQSISPILSTTDGDVFASKFTVVSIENNQSAQRSSSVDQNTNIKIRTSSRRSATVVDIFEPKGSSVVQGTKQPEKFVYQERF